MKHIFGILALTVLCGIVAGCSESDKGMEDSSETGVLFHIARAEQNTGEYNFNAHMNRIYVGERKQEHDKSELHIHSIADLKSIDGTALSFRMTNLKAQWYKFIILSVPKIYDESNGPDYRNFDIFSEEDPEAASCDLNRHLIDYTHILEKAPGTTSPLKEAADGDIFRAVLNRWAENNLIVEENITLKRLNGRLDIDMGILADQFPKQVNSITVKITVPSKMYLTDNNTGMVKSFAPATFTYTTYPNDMKEMQHHIISLNLLPGKVKGSITVKTEDGEQIFNITTMKDVLTIRPNTITHLKFNGISPNFFDVKYAGYTGTEITVEDSWNGGWN